MTEPARLKGCPFCGKQPTLYRVIQEYGPEGDEPAGEYEAYCMIRCDADCGVEVFDEYRSTVIDKWNRRPRCRVPAADMLERETTTTEGEG